MARPNKYNNRKTILDGIKFDSAKEARRYAELKLLEQAGEIKNLELQKRFRLIVGGVWVADYVADFWYFEKLEPGGIWEEVVEDVKGFQTDVYKLKRRLMLAIHAIEIRET